MTNVHNGISALVTANLKITASGFEFRMSRFEED